MHPSFATGFRPFEENFEGLLQLVHKLMFVQHTFLCLCGRRNVNANVTVLEFYDNSIVPKTIRVSIR